MAKQVTVIVSNPNSKDPYDRGGVAFGYYVVEEGVLTMTDGNGEPVRPPPTGELVAHRLNDGEHDGREPDCDDEPSLCGVTVTPGNERDLEANLGSLDRQMDQCRSLAGPRIWCVEEM